jgi:hypothetical protein
MLPEEPDAADPNACHLVFRLPGSGERVSHRFLKDQTVDVLYMYIDSLHIQFENANKFVILQSMPRKEYRDRGRTLGEEGLYPRAVLMVKEDD